MLYFFFWLFDRKKRGIKMTEIRNYSLGVTFEETGEVQELHGNKYVRVRWENCYFRAYNPDGSLRKQSDVQERPIYENADGAHVMPYFKGQDGEWYVVVVHQFRFPVRRFLLEAAGGCMEGRSPQETMAAEVAEEIGVTIHDSGKIRLMKPFYPMPMTVRGEQYGGIVEVRPVDIASEALYLSNRKKEYTERIILPLKKALRMRDAGEAFHDFLTSQLLDMVAKEVGLLVKNY